MPKEFDPDVTAFVKANLPERLPAQLTLKEQATRIGVSDATLSDLLNGDGKIGKKTLPVFAKALGLSVEELVKQARSGRRGFAVARRPLAAVAGTAGPQATLLDLGAPHDTLAMAEEAAHDLEVLDKLKPAKAWGLMRGIRLNKPTAQGYYREARRRLERADGSSVGPREHEAELSRVPGQQQRPQAEAPLLPGKSHRIRGS